MKPRAAMIAALALSLLASSQALAEGQKVEQKPGQPLYLPGDRYQPHPSDLAPETDPYWQQYKKKQQERIEKGLPAEDPYYEPPTVIREETIRYEVVDEKKKEGKHKAPSRWSD